MSDCKTKINWFCTICGQYTLKSKRRAITESIESAYRYYFSLDMVKNVPWAPNVCCLTCVSTLLNFMKRKRQRMPFGIPMIWRLALAHRSAGCYVCVNQKVLKYNRKTRISSYQYKATPLVSLPVPHSDELPVPRQPTPPQPEQGNTEDFGDFFGFAALSVAGMAIYFEIFRYSDIFS